MPTGRETFAVSNGWPAHFVSERCEATVKECREGTDTKSKIGSIPPTDHSADRSAPVRLALTLFLQQKPQITLSLDFGQPKFRSKIENVLLRDLDCFTRIEQSLDLGKVSQIVTLSNVTVNSRPRCTIR